MAVARARLKSHPEEFPDPSRTQHYRRLLARRAAGEPLAYLTGSRDFWSLTLRVTPAVLIPRPETELLVERALARRTAAERSRGGSGHGLRRRRHSRSPASVHTGTWWRPMPARTHSPSRAPMRRRSGSAGVQLRHGDWYQALLGERFDLLVRQTRLTSRRTTRPSRLPPSGTNRGGRSRPAWMRLAACVRWCSGAPRHLAPEGWLLLEHGATQGADVRRELVDAGFRHVRSHRDLAGHERITEGQR